MGLNFVNPTNPNRTRMSGAQCAKCMHSTTPSAATGHDVRSSRVGPASWLWPSSQLGGADPLVRAGPAIGGWPAKLTWFSWLPPRLLGSGARGILLTVALE